MKWKLYQSKPPFDGLYLARAKGSNQSDKYIVKDGVILDSDGDEAININCEWQYISAL